MAFYEPVGTDKKPRYLFRWKGDLWRFIWTLYGRYALACTWLAKIFGEEAGKISNEFLAESADMQDFVLLGKIRKIAEQVCWDK